MADRRGNPTSVAALVDYLSLIPLGHYDKFHQFMEKSGNNVEISSLPAKIFAKAIEHHRDGRHADAQRCLHNAAVLQACIRAKRDWRDYLMDLKERDPDSRERLAEDIEKLRARLPEAVDSSARQQEDPARQTISHDQSISSRHRVATLPHHVRESRGNEEDERQVRQQSSDFGRSPQAKVASANPSKAFIPGNGIHPELIGPWAKKHVGSDAKVEESRTAGRDGYIVTAGRIPTSEMLRILIEDSKKRFDSDPRHASTQSRVKSDPVPGRHADYSAVNYRDDDRPPAQHRTTAKERSSQLEQDDRIEVPVRRQSISGPEERHGTQSTAAQPRKDSQHMIVLLNVGVSSQDYSDRLRVDWAELDHGMYGTCDNMISLKCFLEMSGGAQPEGQSTRISHGYNPRFVTKGIAISLDVSWEGGKAIDQGFVVDMAPDCTAGVVLGRTIIEEYGLLDLARKIRVPDRVFAHKVHTTGPRDKTPPVQPGGRRPGGRSRPRDETPDPGVGGRRPAGR